jgi:hypothetical protein
VSKHHVEGIQLRYVWILKFKYVEAFHKRSQCTLKCRCISSNAWLEDSIVFLLSTSINLFSQTCFSSLVARHTSQRSILQVKSTIGLLPVFLDVCLAVTFHSWPNAVLRKIRHSLIPSIRSNVELHRRCPQFRWDINSFGKIHQLVPFQNLDRCLFGSVGQPS